MCKSRRNLSAILIVVAAVAAPPTLWAQPAEADKVHFLIAADTLARGAKELGLDMDRDNIKKAIEEAAKAQNVADKVSVVVLDKDVMTEKAILDHFRKLNVGANDTLVFYYTGHGGFYPEKGHLLAMRNNYVNNNKKVSSFATIDRKELLAAMNRHHPRCIIALTDCCSSSGLPIFSGTEIAPPDLKFKDTMMKKGKGEVFRDLFFKSRGVVNITAAMTGTPAYGERAKGGSHFTVAMNNALREDRAFFDDNKDGSVDWKEFFPRLTKLTQIESFKIVTDKKGGTYKLFHTPEAFLLGESISAEKEKVSVGGKMPLLEKDESLTSKDATFNKGKNTHFIKNYTVPMKKGNAYLVSLFSSQFDTFLFVKDQADKTLAFNDDYGTTTTRSRILFFPEADGDYKVGVAAFGPTETGDFSLMVQESANSDSLGKDDSKDRYCLGSYSKRHPIHLKAQRSYTVRLESDEFDAYLRVVDEFGNTVALNDDEDDDQGRRNAIVTVRTVSAGTYYLIATSFSPEKVGKFAFFVQD